MVRLPGSHSPNIKNRSSKQYCWLTKMKPIVRCVSNEQLQQWANNNVPGANKELKRRQNRSTKRSDKVS